MSAERSCPRKTFKSIRKTVWKKREKKIRKTIRNATEKCLSPSQAAQKYFTGTCQQILKVFHRPKFAQKTFFFTAMLCKGSHAKSSARISRPKTSVKAVKILEKQACRRGHPWPEGADVHDPEGFPKTSVRKTLGWIFVPYQGLPRKLPRNVPRARPRKCPRKCSVKWSRFTCPVFTCSVRRPVAPLIKEAAPH